MTLSVCSFQSSLNLYRNSLFVLFTSVNFFVYISAPFYNKSSLYLLSMDQCPLSSYYNLLCVLSTLYLIITGILIKDILIRFQWHSICKCNLKYMFIGRSLDTTTVTWGRIHCGVLGLSFFSFSFFLIWWNFVTDNVKVYTSIITGTSFTKDTPKPLFSD